MDGAGSWNCQRCTFLNSNARRVCEMCAFPRPKQQIRRVFVFDCGMDALNGEYVADGKSLGPTAIYRKKAASGYESTISKAPRGWVLGDVKKNYFVAFSNDSSPPMKAWQLCGEKIDPVAVVTKVDSFFVRNPVLKKAEGRYGRSGTYGGKGVYTYTKSGGSGQRFVIAYSSERQRWLFGSVDAPSGGGGGAFQLTSEKQLNKVLFLSKEKDSSAMPPLTTWLPADELPPPMLITVEDECRTRTLNLIAPALSKADSCHGQTVLVIGSGSLEVQGRYFPAERVQGVQIYRKEDKGKQYSVMRAVGSTSGISKWWICRTDRNGIPRDIDFYTVASKAITPPSIGWTPTTSGKLDSPQVTMDGVVYLLNAAIPEAEGRYESSGGRYGTLSFIRRTKTQIFEIKRMDLQGQSLKRWVVEQRPRSSSPSRSLSSNEGDQKGQGAAAAAATRNGKKILYEVLSSGVSPNLRGWSSLSPEDKKTPELSVRPVLFAMSAGTEGVNGEYRFEDMGRFQQYKDKESALPSSDWACPICTFKNAPARSRCEMCQAAKPRPGDLKGDHRMEKKGDTWSIVHMKTGTSVYSVKWNSDVPPLQGWAPVEGDGKDGETQIRGVSPGPEFATARDRAQEQKLKAVVAAFKKSQIDCKSGSVESIEAQCKAKGLKFVDLDFPPDGSSIYTKKKAASSLIVRERENYLGPVRWLRPEEFLGDDYKLYDGITPDDITQGRLGNCWFCCSLSCLAEKPERILGVIVNKKRSEQGIYKVRFCSNGKWKEVIVDDLIPCLPGGGPVFSRNNGKEVWVLIVEKAYAKLYRSYTALKGGHEFQALEDLTGFPAMRIRLQNPNTQMVIREAKLWPDLEKCASKGMVMTLGTGPPQMYAQKGISPDIMRMKTGLAPSHAYSCLQVKEGAGIKLVKIRNPWGTGEWRGPYCDFDTKNWTPEARAAFHPEFKEDGLFHMPWEQVTKWYLDLTVCFTKSLRGKAWTEGRLDGTFLRDEKSKDSNVVFGSEFYRFDVPEGSESPHFFFQIHQQDTRLPSTPPYIELGLNILNAESLTLVGTTMVSRHRKAMTQQQLAPGKYLVAPFCGAAFLPVAKPRKYVITIHGDDEKAMSTIRPTATDASAGLMGIQAMPTFIDNVLNRVNSIVTDLQLTPSRSRQTAPISGPPSVLVLGSGSAEADGVYSRAGAREGAMQYKRRFKEKEYTVCRSRSQQTGKTKWWICRTDRNEIKQDIDFYNVESSSPIPPPFGWQMKAVKGKEPIPMVSTKASICVLAPTCETACGEYLRVSDESTYTWRKKGEQKGTQSKVEIRVASKAEGAEGEEDKWEIVDVGDGKSAGAKVLFYAKLTNATMPPSNHWIAKADGVGDATLVTKEVFDGAKILNGMGFSDTARNIKVICEARGSADKAVGLLLK